jgi:hypothetical protein
MKSGLSGIPHDHAEVVIGEAGAFSSRSAASARARLVKRETIMRLMRR